jgi:hypothetical protein
VEKVLDFREAAMRQVLQNKISKLSKMERVLYLRISKIISLIPEDFPNKNAIAKDLLKVQDIILENKRYAIENRWLDVAYIIKREFGKITGCGWADEICHIYEKSFDLTL